jgi:shikimate kinase
MVGVDDQPIVLVGSMGTGKTTVGRMLAEQLGRPFLDNDAGFRALTGSTVREVEERDGIETVHRLEAEVLLRALATSPSSVITAAASVVDDPTARDRLRGDDVFVVWLVVPPELLAERAGHGGYRPQLGVGSGEAARLLDEARRGAYAGIADLPISVGARGPGEVVNEIAQRVSGDM